jgi:hypothetical protein
MKHLLLSAVAAAAAALAIPATAHTVVFTATLTGASEFPVNDSAGTGSATVSFDLDLYTMRVQASFSGLTGTSTNSHIHCCTGTSGLPSAAFPDPEAAASAAGNVGVATMTPTFAGFPSGVTSGSYDNTFNMLALSSYNSAFVTLYGGDPSLPDDQKAANAFTALFNGAEAGQAYLNIHSSYKAGGEIRGFLAAVPEPETYALMLAGLGLVGWAARRSQKG